VTLIVVPQVSLQSLAPAIKKDSHVGLAQSQLGLVIMLGTLGYVIGKTTLGPLTDVVGSHRMLLVATLVIQAAVAAFAYMGSGLPLFVLCWMAAQYASAGCWPALSKAISRWFDVPQMGRWVPCVCVCVCVCVLVCMCMYVCVCLVCK